MLRTSLLSVLMLFMLPVFPGFKCFAQEASDATVTSTPAGNKTQFTIKFGQGGFRDGRSPQGKLGGGQLSLDIKPANLPLVFSFSSEYYTNSADPTHPYEISNSRSLNILYTAQLLDFATTDYFLGGGIGMLEVPGGESNPDATVEGNLQNLVAGIHIKSFEKIGFYGAYQYLHAKKDAGNVRVIDFNEHILLLGITYSFSL